MQKYALVTEMRGMWTFKTFTVDYLQIHTQTRYSDRRILPQIDDELEYEIVLYRTRGDNS